MKGTVSPKLPPFTPPQKDQSQKVLLPEEQSQEKLLQEQQPLASPKEIKQVTQSTRENDVKVMQMNAVTAAVTLSIFAELFREVEILYMEKPKILAKICRRMIRATTFDFSFLTQIPIKNLHINLESVKHSLETLIEMTKSPTTANFAKSYWWRQRSYYNQQRVSCNHSSNFDNTYYTISVSPDLKGPILKELPKVLEPFARCLYYPFPLTKFTSDSADMAISAAISAYHILRENKELSEQVCQDLILAVWVGHNIRPMQQDVQQCIMDFAEICFHLHPKIQKIRDEENEKFAELKKFDKIRSYLQRNPDTQKMLEEKVAKETLLSSSIPFLRSPQAMLGSSLSSSSSSCSSSLSSSLGTSTSSLKTFSPGGGNT